MEAIVLASPMIASCLGPSPDLIAAKASAFSTGPELDSVAAALDRIGLGD